MTEREKLCFELGINLAARICDDIGLEYAGKYLVNFTLEANLNNMDNGEVFEKMKQMQQEIINEFPKLWEKQS